MSRDKRALIVRVAAAATAVLLVMGMTASAEAIPYEIGTVSPLQAPPPPPPPPPPRAPAVPPPVEEPEEEPEKKEEEPKAPDQPTPPGLPMAPPGPPDAATPPPAAQAEVEDPSATGGSETFTINENAIVAPAPTTQPPADAAIPVAPEAGPIAEPVADEPEATPKTAPRYSQYNHLCITYSASNLTSVLNGAGNQGWELTSVGSLDDDQLICFRRPR